MQPQARRQFGEHVEVVVLSAHRVVHQRGRGDDGVQGSGTAAWSRAAESRSANRSAYGLVALDRSEHPSGVIA